MLRRGWMLVTIGLLAGCQQHVSSFGPPEAAAFQCVPSDKASVARTSSVASDSKESRHLTIYYDSTRQQMLLSVDGGRVNYLSLVSGVKEHLYSNAEYAWKSDGKTNLFTDLVDVRIYSCVLAAKGEAATLDQAAQ